MANKIYEENKDVEEQRQVQILPVEFVILEEIKQLKIEVMSLRSEILKNGS